MAITQLRTLQQVLLFMDTYFDTNATGFASRQDGTVPNDIINTEGNELQNLYTIMTFMANKDSIPGLRSLISTDASTQAFQAQLAIALNKTAQQTQALISQQVDNMAADWDLTRIPASFATLTERFYTTSNVNVNIPIGTTVQTQGTNPIVYATSINVVSQPVALDPVTNLYFIDVPCIAAVSGSASNVPLQVVNVISPALPGFSAARNITASSGGVDQETDSALLDRIEVALQGFQLDTIFGLQKLIGQQTGVVKVFVLDNGNPLVTRGVGNQVDAWVYGDIEQSKTDTITYDTGMGGEIILSKQPVSEILSVLVNAVLVPTSSYNFVKDTSGFANSVRGNDALVWTMGNEPSNGDTVDIEYNYNSLIETLQTLLSQPQYQIPNSDILVRQVYNVLIDVTMTVIFTSGFSAVDVKATITTNLETYFTNIGVGKSVFESNLVQVIEETPGVDHVVLPFDILAISPAVTSSSSIPITANQVAILNNLVIN